MDHRPAATRRALAGAGLVAILIVGLAAVALALQPTGDIRASAPPIVEPTGTPSPGETGAPPGVNPTPAQPTGDTRASAPPIAIAPTAPTSAPVGKGKGGPLTPRLQLLADPAFRALSPEEQARRLSLPVSGPGSIMQRPDGRILVDIRLTDTTAATLARLSASGAHQVFVDDALRIATAEVAPSQLTALAAVQPEVLSVVEVLQPSTNAG
jgi:hypothetical protein